MTETPRTEEVYAEMDLAQILRELYRWKWLHFGLTVVVGILTAGATLRMPNIYESSAALVIREPELPITGEYPSVTVQQIDSLPVSRIQQPIAPMSVETLQLFAESTDVKWTVFEVLWEKQALEKWKHESFDKADAFRELQYMLSIDLKKQGDRAGGFLPILVLTARAQSPVESAVVANVWAQVLETRSRNIYTEGVETLNAFIGMMYEDSNDTLAAYQDDLSKKVLEAAFDLKRVRINTVKEKSVGLESSIYDLGIEVAVNEAFVAEATRRIAEQQYEEEWIGTVAERAAMKKDGYPFDIENLSVQAGKTVRTVARMVKQAESLRVFRREQNLLVKQEEFEHYRVEFARILKERARVDDELPSVQATLAALSDQLKTIPEKITLNKAITDDALWSAYVNKRFPEDMGFVPLKSETVNLLYQSTEKSMIKLTAKIETLKSSSAQLGKSEEIAARFIVNIESEIDTIRRELVRRKDELGASERLLSLIREDYTTEIERVEKLVVANVRNRKELEIKRTLRRTIRKDEEGLKEEVSKYEHEIEVLSRRVQKTKGVQVALASKAEEVALLRVSAEEASRTGTAILYAAVANPLKVAPARSKIVLASMLVAFVLCGFLICSAKMIRTTS